MSCWGEERPRPRCGPAIFPTITCASTPTTAVDATVDAATLQQLIARAEALLTRLEAWVPGALPGAPAWHAAVAWRWRRRAAGGWLQAVPRPHLIRLEDLKD